MKPNKHIDKRLFLIISLFLSFLLSNCNANNIAQSDTTSSSNNLNPNPSNQTTHTIIHDAITRKYIVYLPSSYSNATAIPLILNFHGGDMTASSYLSTMDMRHLADSEEFMLVYPEGTAEIGNPNTLIWNSGPFPNSKSNTDDLSFIESLIQELSTDYPKIDEQRIYAVGYSNGGFMAYTLACKKSNLIAAIAITSGMMTDQNACTPDQAIPIIHFHGRSDYQVPLSFANTAKNFWINQNNLTLNNTNSYVQGNTQFDQYSNNAGIEFQFFQINNAEHYATFQFQTKNGTTQDSRNKIWTFLSKYNNNGLR